MDLRDLDNQKRSQLLISYRVDSLAITLAASHIMLQMNSMHY